MLFKRGLNELVTSILIILLVIVSITIIWGVLKPTIEETASEADVGSITTNVEILKNSLSTNLTDCNISFSVSAGAGNSKINSLKVVIQQKNLLEKTYDYPQNESETFDIRELESKRITLVDCSINENDISSITIYPVFANDKIGNPSNKKASTLTSTPVVENNQTNPGNNGTSVVQKGSRLLGIDITQGLNSTGGEMDYETAFNSADSFGIDFTSLTLPWEEFMEPTQGNYDPYNLLSNQVNPFYPSKGVSLALILAPPIDTNSRTTPSYLSGYRLNDTQVVQAYINLLNYSLPRIPDVDLVYLSIGNEIDVYLGNNLTLWDEYIDFYNKTSSYLKQHHSNIKVGSKATQDAYFYEPQKSKMQTITEMSDVVLVTYYPIYADFFTKGPEVVFQDFDTLDNFSAKPIYITETGYSSSSITNSSEQKQKQFFENLMTSWDSHASGIPLVNILWLHDRTDEKIQEFEVKYNNTNGVFTEHIRTLGIKNVTGSDKPSAQFLRTAFSERGW